MSGAAGAVRWARQEGQPAQVWTWASCGADVGEGEGRTLEVALLALLRELELVTDGEGLGDGRGTGEGGSALYSCWGEGSPGSVIMAGQEPPAEE